MSFEANFPAELPANLADYTIVPTTLADTKAFFPKMAPYRIKALTIRVGGVIYGIGGYATLPNGQRVGFFEAKEDHIKFAAPLVYRATRQFMESLVNEGVTRVIARCDYSRAKAERWLEHFGFVRADGDVFLWRGKQKAVHGRLGK
jgi:hypothetical protein